MAAPLDRIGDLFRKFPRTDVKDGVGEGLDSVGAGLDAKDVGGDRKDVLGGRASKKDVLDDHPSPRDVPGNRVP